MRVKTSTTMSIKVKAIERNVSFDKSMEKWAYVMQPELYSKLTQNKVITGGFLLPPMGIIDSSVLTAVGELLMFAVLAQVPHLIEAARNGRSIRLQKGDFSAEVSSGA